MTIAYIFPGQGSQKVGMSKDLYDEFSFVREMFQEVDDTLRQNLSKIIFEGPAEELTMTENTQPALMLCSVATARVLEHATGKAISETGKYIAGHSLGEFSALTAANSISLRDAANILKIRGQAMQEAVPQGKGTMFALLGSDKETANEICQSITKGICEIANDNSIGQLVLSGTNDAIDKAIELSKEKGLKAIKLNVSAPFHCSMMKPAQEKLASYIDRINFNKPSLDLIANVTANSENNPDKIKANLITQVTGTVRWTESIQKMIKLGVTEFIEVGPGKVLSGLIKRIDKDVETKSLQSLEDINNYVTSL